MNNDRKIAIGISAAMLAFGAFVAAALWVCAG